MQKIELLSPAKDLECGITAINCGADAVYIGAPQFGAREAAGNSLEDISELIKYAHKYWAKIYVTVNTLLHDEEIPSALHMISQLYDAGVDGIVIQDVGLLECDLPPVPLIASTQMHNDTPEKVAFLEQLGISRVILPRELDLDQIKKIRASSNVELEFFVHGALCVCYSGQCYLSYALGGRSGNRGQCAQPCRKLYSLTDDDGHVLAENKHLLSLKDLNLSDYLRDLVEAGICSFKIEGRLKDKAYVSNVVSFYRQKLDEVLADLGMEKNSSGSSKIDFEPNVNKTFNRGYTTHFLNGRNKLMGAVDTPKMMGELVGKVISVSNRHVLLDSKIELHNGDGVCYFDQRGELQGTVVNNVNEMAVILDKPAGLVKGAMVYRNSDHEFLTRLAKAKIERMIDVKLTLSETPEGFKATALDEDEVTADYLLVCDKIPAEKPEVALENIKKQLSKSGGTDFLCSEVSIETSKAYFLPISVLNEMRRGVLEKLAEARIENRPVQKSNPINNDVPYPENELMFTGNVINFKADEFYRRHGVTSIEPGAETGLTLYGRRVMATRYCLKHQLGICPKLSGDAQLSEPLCLTDAEGHKLQLLFDCDECRMEIKLIG